MIISAAIRFNYNSEEIVIGCWRHGIGLKMIEKMLGNINVKKEEGFFDNNGNFLNREEALKHALMCGQLNQTTRWYKTDTNDTKLLYSEDLY